MEEVSALPGAAWEIPPPRIPKKDEPKECQHPGCKTTFGTFSRTHHCRSCGQVFCSTHSSKKLVVPGVTDGKAERVCDTCYELHESGRKHNIWRYLRLLELDKSIGEAKRRLIYSGMTDAFTEHSNAGTRNQIQAASMNEEEAMAAAIAASMGGSADFDFSESESSVSKPSAPTSMLNHFAPSGYGLEIIHGYVKTGSVYSPETQIAAWKLFSAAMNAYCNESGSRGEEEVLTLMLDQLNAFQTLSEAVKSASTPDGALMYILEPFIRMGRAPRVQQQARSSGMLPALGQLLLSENVEVSTAVITTLERLQEDCLENRRALTEANIPFLLCPLLGSSAQSVREAAAAALARFVHATKHEEAGIAQLTCEALAGADCIPTLRPLLSASSKSLRMDALRVLHALSGNPSLVHKMIHAGVVAPTVSMLTQPDASDEALEKAARIVCNVSVIDKDVRARVHGAGGLAIAVQLLKSPKPNLRVCACELVSTFAGDLEAQVVLRDSNAVETLLKMLSATHSMGNMEYLVEQNAGPGGGFGVYASEALSKMLSTLGEIGASHRITAVQSGGCDVFARLLQSCREILKSSDISVSISAANLARHMAACVDALGRDPQALGAMYFGGSQGSQALGSAITSLLQVLQVIVGDLSPSGATISAASEIVSAVGSLCGASLPPQSHVKENPLLSRQLNHALAAANMARQHVTGRQGIEYFMPLLKTTSASGGGITREKEENMRLNALRALLVIVSDEVACGGRTRQVQHLTAMADRGAIEVVAKKLSEGDDKNSGLDAFMLLCGRVGRAAYGGRHKATMQQCVQSVAQCLNPQKFPMDIVAKSCAILRDISSDSGNWAPIKQYALPTLARLLSIDSHLADPNCDSTSVVVDAATCIANMAVLEEHCRIVLQHGGITSLSWLIAHHNSQHLTQKFRQGRADSLRILNASLNALGHLCESSAACREAAVRDGLFTQIDRNSGQKVVGPLLMLLAQTVRALEENGQGAEGLQNAPPSGGQKANQSEASILKQMETNTADRALYCVEVISRDPRSRMALVDCEASMNLVLQLPKTRNRALRGRAMAIVLQVTHDGSSASVVWHNVRQQGDINLAFELLAVGDSSIKAQACAAIKALSTPAIPGQAPQVTAAELVRRGVGPTLVGVIADEAAGAGDAGARKAQACAAECLVIMTGGADESHQTLISNGIAKALTVLLSVPQDQPLAEIVNLNSGLQILRNICLGSASESFWHSLVSLEAQQAPQHKGKSSSLGRFFEAFAAFLTDSTMGMESGSGEIPHACAVLASVPVKILCAKHSPVVRHLLRVGIPRTLVSLVREDQHASIRIAALKALEKLVEQVGLARALCNEDAVPVVLEMLRSPSSSSQAGTDNTRQELAAMLAALTKSDPIRVAESMVSPMGIEAIKLMLSPKQSAKTQVSIVGILSSMAQGSAAVRAAICDAALEIGPAIQRALVSLGVNIAERGSNLGEASWSDSGKESKSTTDLKVVQDGPAAVSMRSSTVDLLYSGANLVDASAADTSPIVKAADVSRKGVGTPHDSSGGSAVMVATSSEVAIDALPAIPRPLAAESLGHCVELLLRLAALDVNRQMLCEKAPHLIDYLVAAMSVSFRVEDLVSSDLDSESKSVPDPALHNVVDLAGSKKYPSSTDIRINAMKAFGQLSLAAPVVGTEYHAWQRGYATLVKVPAASATLTEQELTAALNALRTLISVYPEIASDPPALLKVVGPMAIVATAKDLKVAGLQLLVQMLSSHELVEKAFGSGASSSPASNQKRKLVAFTEQLVTDLERLRDGMAPSLAALQGGGNDLLCMWSLLTLRALCANVGFRRSLLSTHTSVLGLLSSFEGSRNPCIAHIAESTRHLIGGDVDVGVAPPPSASLSAPRKLSASSAGPLGSVTPPFANGPPAYGAKTAPPQTATPPNYTSQMGREMTTKRVAPMSGSDQPYGAVNRFNLTHAGNSNSGASSPFSQKRPPRSSDPLPPAYNTSKGDGQTRNHYAGYGMSPAIGSSVQPPQAIPSLSTSSFAPPPVFSNSNRNSSLSVEEDAVRQCVEMGFDAQQARQTLAAVGWDVRKAAAVLSDDLGASSNSISSNAGSSSSRAVQQAKQGTRTLRFKIPNGMSPGQVVTIQDPVTKSHHRVTIPQNASPGALLSLQVSAS